MTKYFLITFLLLAQIPDYHPELLPNPLVDVGIKVGVNRSAEGYFIYNYEIYNPSNNNGRIVSIDIDILRGTGNADLRSDGLKMAKKCFNRSSDLMAAGTPVIPVGIDSPPNWDCGIGTNKTAFWSAYDYYYHILPGQSLSGLVLSSYGLPGIREIKVSPLIVDSIYPNVEEFKVDKHELRKVMLQDKERVSYKGKTICPAAPPAAFNPASFLDYIIDLKHQAVTLGWIKNEGIVNSLDVKLENAKKKIAEGSPGAAKNILNAFINEVEAQGCATYENCPPGKHLTSEAYALLKYNAQYLIDNLSK